MCQWNWIVSHPVFAQNPIQESRKRLRLIHRLSIGIGTPRIQGKCSPRNGPGTPRGTPSLLSQGATLWGQGWGLQRRGPPGFLFKNICRVAPWPPDSALGSIGYFMDLTDAKHDRGSSLSKSLSPFASEALHYPYRRDHTVQDAAAEDP